MSRKEEGMLERRECRHVKGMRGRGWDCFYSVIPQLSISLCETLVKWCIYWSAPTLARPWFGRMTNKQDIRLAKLFSETKQTVSSICLCVVIRWHWGVCIYQRPAPFSKYPHFTASFLGCSFSGGATTDTGSRRGVLTFISVTHFQQPRSCGADVSTVLSPGSLTASENSPCKIPKKPKRNHGSQSLAFV